MNTTSIKDALMDEADAMMKLAESLSHNIGRPLNNREEMLIRKAMHSRLKEAFEEIGFMYLTGVDTDKLIERAKEAIPYFTQITDNLHPKK